jgi:hypothetical protein
MNPELLLHEVEADGAVSSSLPSVCGVIGGTRSASEHSFDVSVKEADRRRKNLDWGRDCAVVRDILSRVGNYRRMYQVEVLQAININAGALVKAHHQSRELRLRL